MEYNRIKSAYKQRGFTLERFCEAIGITKQGFGLMIKNHTMTIKTLEKISEVLELPVTYFFDDSEAKMPSTRSATDKDLVKCKQQVIELQAELIALLKTRQNQ